MSRATPHKRVAICTKGPGVALRPPPGTKYRVFGLMVSHEGTDAVATSAYKKRTVYIPNVDSDDEPSSRKVLTVTTTTDATLGGFDEGGVINVREYDRLLDMVMALPMGESPEERASVRGYTWGGMVSPFVRPHVWRLLCGCIPCAPASHSHQLAELRRKREKYENFVSEYYNISIAEFTRASASHQEAIQRGCSSTATTISLDDRAILAQIALDIPRHKPAIFHYPETASALARCLFLWSRRYPAVGYVQGIDDIMVVFFFIFLQGAVNECNIRNKREERKKDPSGSTSETHSWIPETVVFTCDVQKLRSALDKLPSESLKAAEADTYLCGGFFLSWLQDNFVLGQPGIRRSMALVERLLAREDPGLLDAIVFHGIALMDCCFQWVHCLLARELPFELLLLLWERYMAMGNSEMVLDFHACVCAALVMQLRDDLLGQSVDVVIRRLKDPLDTHSKKQQQQQKPPVSGSVHSRPWLENLIKVASRLFHEHSASLLT